MRPSVRAGLVVAYGWLSTPTLQPGTSAPVTVSNAAILMAFWLLACRKSPPTYTAALVAAMARTELSVVGTQPPVTVPVTGFTAATWRRVLPLTVTKSPPIYSRLLSGERVSAYTLASVSARQPGIGLPVVASSAARWEYASEAPAVVITWVNAPPM